MKQNKRVSTCVLILVLVAAALFVLPAQVRAETVTESQTQMETFVEGDYTYTVDKEEATIISCATSVAGEVVVPERLGGFPVVEIAEKAFAGCSGITVVIGECTCPSLGVGYELAYAEKFGKPCHIFYDRTKTQLSAMLTGNPYFHIHPYETEEEIYPLLDQILR